MLIFSTILFIILAFFLQLTILIAILPFFIGLVIIIACNLRYKSGTDRFAPIWWNILTPVVTILSSVLLWLDIFGDAGYEASLPFAIIGIYGLASLGYFTYLADKEKKDKEQDLNLAKNYLDRELKNGFTSEKTTHKPTNSFVVKPKKVDPKEK